MVFHETCIRVLAQQALECACSAKKVKLTLALPAHDGVKQPALALQPQVGQPAKPMLVAPKHLPTRSVQSAQGRGMLLHALAHIEFNAINLALDLIVRFANMPAQFYLDWLKVAQEEAHHHQLLCQRLQTYGVVYGDYPAHNGLWEVATKTQTSLLARLALVPRLHEARGLDACPAIREKLAQAGALESAHILDIILRDEIGHVEIGNYWYNALCQAEHKDPIAEFERCLRDYDVPLPRSPFNYEARKQAGFSEQELVWLQQLEAKQNA